MLNLKFFKWSFIAVLLSGFLFASCSKDDDMSLGEMQDEIRKNGNDLMADGLFGAVKSYKATYYYNSSWKNNAVEKGDKDYEYIREYDKNGFLTKSEYKNFENGDVTNTSVSEIISRDNKNRTTVSVSSTKYANSPSYYYKYEYTYDDSKKEAVCINSNSSDGIDYEVSGKTVYKLNKYGKIDGNNSEEFSSLRSANDEDNHFEENAYSGQYSIYDEKGNITQSYYKYKYGDIVTISSYREMGYVYY